MIPKPERVAATRLPPSKLTHQGDSIMTKLKWWFRIVGGLYLLLAVLNMYGTFVNPAFFAQALPFPADQNVVKAFVVGWSPFAFEVVGIATFMLWGARRPPPHTLPGAPPPPL